MKDELFSLSNYVFERTRHRLEGLTDGEYLWEPVPHPWSVHVSSGGAVVADFDPSVQRGPFTTIAWRLWHLTGCYGSARNEQWLRATDDGGEASRCTAQPTAKTAVEALGVANDWWRKLLITLTEDELTEPLGPIAGPYSESNKASFVLHQIDEQIHHGAEVGVLRDLYEATSSR